MSADNSGPLAVPTPATPYMMQPTAEQLVRQTEQAWIDNMHRANDAARAAAAQITLVAITGFTVVDDENPHGRIVNRGDEITISEFDLPRYLGKCLPRKDDSRRHTMFG